MPEVIGVLISLKAAKIADIGCENRALCSELARRGLKSAGIEYDEKGYQIAKSSHPHIKFYNLDVQDNPQKVTDTEGLLDAVISSEVVEHLFSPHLLPVFASELLKPGGHLVVTPPYHGYLKNLALSIFGKWDDHHTPLWHGGHIKFWSKKTLTELLESNGFKVTSFSGVGRLPYLWKSMVVVASKAI